MAAQAKLPRYLRQRDGGFYVRMGVPAELRPFIGRSELHEALGSNRADALKRHHAIVARFQGELEAARLKLTAGEKPKPAPRPQAIRKFAEWLYRSQVEQDNDMRDTGFYADLDHDPRVHSELFDGGYAKVLRDVASGAASDDKIAATIGWALDEFNPGLDPTAPEWRRIARQLAGVQLEVLERRRENNEARPQEKPRHPLLNPPAPGEDKPEPVPLLSLLAGYLKELAASGRGAAAEKQWTPAFKAFIRFLGHDDATRIVKADVIKFKDHLMQTLAPKTIRDTYVASLRVVLQWAMDNQRIGTEANPAAKVKIRVPKKILNREKGFTEAEALAVLKASRTYEPKHSENPQTRESSYLTHAKLWVPFLCAHTGSRISEMTQLRKQDVMDRDGVHFIRITPDAGSVKTGQYRDVPIHAEVIEAGFLKFVEAQPEGPLFYAPGPKRGGVAHPSKTVSGRLSEWVRSLNVIPLDVDPNHGWRHRFKTVGIELDLHPRVIDAIQGHGARTAGEDYGDVTMKARKVAIDKMPRYFPKPKK